MINIAQYKSIEFFDNPSKEEIIIRFKKIGETQIAYSSLTRLSEFKLKYENPSDDSKKNSKRKKIKEIIFEEDSEILEELFDNLLDKAIHHLTHIITKKPLIYLHKEMHLPLMGLIFIGIVDRDTSCIEVKPLTGCNLNCIYCSVDEGSESKKDNEYLIEKDYLIQELRKHIIHKLEIAQGKAIPPYEVHIGTQGEPTMYADLVDLVKDIKGLNTDEKIKTLSNTDKQIKTISIDTNGVLWTKELADKLIKAGLNQINISLNAVSVAKASQIAGMPYAPEKVQKIIEYIAEKHMSQNPELKVLISPIYIHKINDDELEEIIKYIKSLQIKFDTKKIMPGIQNFLYYKGGRNPAKELNRKKFKKKLTEWEETYNIKLQLNLKDDFHIVMTNVIPRPMKKFTPISPKYAFEGPNSGEMVCHEEERLILATGVRNQKDLKEMKIYRTKHNIFMAAPEMKNSGKGSHKRRDSKPKTFKKRR